MKTNLFFCLIFLVALMGQAQDKEKLGVQEVLVTKSYTPSLSDVFKIRTQAEGIDSLKSTPIPLDYKLLDVPVVSTFVPNKATPLKLQRQERTIEYNSVLGLGLGNQGQLDVEFGLSLPLDRQQYLGLDLLSTKRGRVPDTSLRSDQSQTLVAVAHDYYTNKAQASQQLRFDTRRTNYYGLPDSPGLLSQFQTENLNPQQRRNYLQGSSRWIWYDNFLQKATLKLQHTADDFSTSEQLVTLNAQMRLEIFDAYLTFSPHVQLVRSQFAKDYFSGEAVETQQRLLSSGVQWVNLKNRFKYKIGLQGYYWGDTANTSEQQWYVYPDLTLLYQPKKSKIQPYLYLSGGLDTNSYTTFSNQNPFVAPTLALRPTDRAWDAKLGFDTVFNTGVTFGFESFYTQKRWAPLFQKLAFNPATPSTAYGFVNSYGVLYDHQQKFGAQVKANLELQEDNQLSIVLGYAAYQQEKEEAAWNLPGLTAKINGEFKFFNRLGFSFDLDYWGNRTVAERPVFLNQSPEANSPVAVKLKGVTQLQLEARYALNDQWNMYLQSQLLAGDSAQVWYTYPTYTNLLLVGMRYKFDILF